MDRSVVFSALLHLSPEFGRLPVEASLPLITEVVSAWQKATGETDLYEFTKRWLAQHPITEEQSA